MPQQDPAKLVKVSLKFLGISAEWIADPTERRAAWSLYVELVTRISTQSLSEHEGLDREALNSLFGLFQTTRQILREAGPNVGASGQSVGGIAIAVLNRRLRPFLANWHPKLDHLETRSAPDSPQIASEEDWTHHQEFRAALAQLQIDLGEYAAALANIAGVDVHTP
jgi:hypothetical protein